MVYKQDVPFPAYVLDCMHYLVAWNRYVPFLFGIAPGEPTLSGLARQSLLATWFDADSLLAALIAEPDMFFPALIRAFRSEMQQFRTESWYGSVFAQVQRLTLFCHYWAAVEHEPAPASAARALVPVRLVIPGVGPLEFRLSSEHFVRDARFRLVYFFPADPATMQQCAAWAAQKSTV